MRQRHGAMTWMETEEPGTSKRWQAHFPPSISLLWSVPAMPNLDQLTQSESHMATFLTGSPDI